MDCPAIPKPRPDQAGVSGVVLTDWICYLSRLSHIYDFHDNENIARSE